MRTRLTLSLFSLIAVLVFYTGPARALTDVSAQSAVLMDVQTGQVLYAHNAHQRRPPASTTKIMTTLLALSGSNLNTLVTISPHAAAVGEASLELTVNEKLTMEELVYGALMQSGNDACVAIAEQVAGNEGAFVNLMNEKARVLGAYDTNFVNTNGLPAWNHYSSAYDLAVLARYALNNPEFNKIVATREKIINQHGHKVRYLQNTNKLLWRYPFADGVKTGTTDAAGPCLVASATKDGRRLLAVVLNSQDRYSDTAKLLDYGFQSFHYQRAVKSGTYFSSIPVQAGQVASVPVVVKGTLGAVLANNQHSRLATKVELTGSLKAPVRKNQSVGRLILLLDGQPVQAADLVTARAVPRLPDYILFWQKIKP